jgi:hypothetical protein
VIRTPPTTAYGNRSAVGTLQRSTVQQRVTKEKLMAIEKRRDKQSTRVSTSTPDVSPHPTGTTYSSGPEHTAALLRHFADLRDGTHGGASARRDKERLFASAVPLLDTHARQALEEINTYLLLDTGEVTATGVRRSGDGGIDAVWALSWPEQQAAGLKPVVIRAYFDPGFAHPHLQSGSVGDWPLNVFDEEQAAMELSTLRAMAAADIHNLVFQLGGDVRIIPATVKGLDA